MLYAISIILKKKNNNNFYLESCLTNYPPICVSDLHLLPLITSEPKMSQPTNLTSQVFLKTLVNYPSHTILLQTPQLQITVEENWQAIHATTEQRCGERWQILVLFLHLALCGLSGRGSIVVGVLETDKKRQHQAETQWCVWHSDTNRHAHTQMHALGVYMHVSPLQTASYRGDNYLMLYAGWLNTSTSQWTHDHVNGTVLFKSMSSLFCLAARAFVKCVCSDGCIAYMCLCMCANFLQAPLRFAPPSVWCLLSSDPVWRWRAWSSAPATRGFTE